MPELPGRNTERGIVEMALWTFPLALLVLCGFVTAWIAWTRNGNPVAWFTAGIMLGPIGILWAMHEFPGREQ